MLRISERSDLPATQGIKLLRLEGQVTGPWVAELRRVCTEAFGNDGHATPHLVLDLSGVFFLDADGIALFRELSERRVRFSNCSAFIAEQLKGVADVDG
jgi:hypothetical protein